MRRRRELRRSVALDLDAGAGDRIGVATPDEIRVFAEVLDRFGATRDEDEARALLDTSPPESAASKLFQLLQDLDARDVPVQLRDIGFFRFIVANGLIQAQRMIHSYRVIAFQALAAGLREFADYLAYLDGDSDITDVEKHQKRFFAFCIAQLIEIGFDMDALLMTMKGDTADQGDAYELRRIREDGPDAFNATYLFDAKEKELWNALFDARSQEATSALQSYYVTTYAVPFIATPPPV